MISVDDVVVSYWAIGPSFRRALLKTIKTALERKDMFKFIILTDYVNDFKEFAVSEPKCLAVLDLDEQRSNYPWSFELEPIPLAKTEREYAQQFRKLMETKRFSYGLHRFSLPWLMDRGHFQFILIDTDVSFGRRDLSMQEWVDGYLDFGVPLVAYGAYRANSENHHIVYNALADTIKKRFPELDIPRNLEQYEYNDGPFRFYNFSSYAEAAKFFDVWNFSIKYVLKHIDLLNILNMVGPVFYHDEFILGIIYHILHMSSKTIAGPAIEMNHAIENRYYSVTQGYCTSADTLEEFYQINNINKGDLI